jgi:acyl transferase domain-containing protein
LADGVRYLREQKCEVFLELGPGETLLAPGSQCLPEQTELWLPSFREGQDEWRQLLETVGSLHVRGVKVDWLAFDRDYPRRKLPLPTYPFQGQRHWFEPSEFLPPQSGVSSP